MLVSMTVVTDWRARLLDLLNTTPVVDGQVTDVLNGSWLRGHGAADEAEDDVRRLRDELQRVVRGEVAATVLEPYLTGVTQTPALVDDAVSWRLDADWAARMVLAWGDVQADSPGRLKPCANDECHKFLLDTTRAGTARWCSMKVCGNRMKARRHYDRTAGRPE